MMHLLDGWQRKHATDQASFRHTVRIEADTPDRTRIPLLKRWGKAILRKPRSQIPVHSDDNLRYLVETYLELDAGGRRRLIETAKIVRNLGITAAPATFHQRSRRPSKNGPS